jgi:hypothetical protein
MHKVGREGVEEKNNKERGGKLERKEWKEVLVLVFVEV